MIAIYLMMRTLFSSLVSNKNSNYIALAVDIYFVYIAVLLVPYIYNGRPHMGLILHFLIVCTFLHIILRENSRNSRRMYPIIIILMITLLLTHYTNLIITGLALSTIIVIERIVKRRLNTMLISLLIFLLILVIFSIIYNKFIYENILPYIENLIYNLRQLPYYIFGRKLGAYYYTPTKIFGQNIVLLLLKRVTQLLKILSVLTIYVIAFNYLCRSLMKSIRNENLALTRVINIVALIGVICGIYEKLIYNVVEPYFGFRYEILYGLLVLLSILGKLACNKERHYPHITIIGVLLLCALGILGTIVDNAYLWNYKEKQYACSSMNFLLNGLDVKLHIYTDPIMAGELECLSNYLHVLDVIDPIPYMKFGVILSRLNIKALIANLNKYDIDGILLYISEIPLQCTGAGWDFKLLIQSKHVQVLAYRLNIIFNANRSVLLILPGGVGKV